MSVETDNSQPSLSAVFERISRLAGAAALALGLLVLLGWGFGIEQLKDPAHRQAMVPNTALCFVLLGGALVTAAKSAVPSRRATRMVLSSMALLIALLRVAEYVSQDLGVDQWLFRATNSPFAPPARMALVSAISFVMLGLAVALLDVGTRPGRRPSEWLSFLTAIPALAGAADYAVDWRPDFTGIAVHTVAGLLLLCLGVLAARPDVGWMQTISSRYGGGAAARRLLPFAILVPLIVASLRWAGYQAGMYRLEFGVAITTSSTIFLLALAVWWNARQLNRLDARRLAEAQRADEELRRRNRALRAMHACGQALVRATSETELLQEICRVIVDEGGYRTAWVGYKEDDANKTVRFVAHYGISEQYARAANITWADVERGCGPTGMAIRTGKVQSCDDVLTDPRMLPWRETALAQGFCSTAVFPLIQAGITFGALSIYSAQPHAFHDEELRLLGRLADDLAYGIVSLRTRAERERMERELQAERQRFGDVLDRLPAYVVLLAPDYTVPFANKYFRERFGESGGRRCFEYLFHRDSPCEICESYKVLRDGQPRQWDWTGPDGREYAIFDFLFREKGMDMVLEMGIDVTERKRAEEKLQQAALYARSLIEASLDPLVTIGKDARIVDVNRAAELITGCERERLIGSEFCRYFTEPAAAHQAYEQAFAAGAVRNCELSIRHSSGALTHVLYNAAVYRNAAGEIEGVFAAARDITERKQTEAKLQQASLYARNLIEASLDPLVTIRDDGRIMDVNHATELVTGLTREQLIGTDFADYFTEPHKAREGYLLVFAEGTVRDYPLSIRHLSGPVTDVVYNAAVYRNAAGEIEGVFAAARDITDRKRAEEALAARSAELERSNRELQDFASIASHDLQEPLRKVQAFGDRLREHSASSLDETSRDYLRRMQNAAERMSSLIEALLQYSRVTSRARPFERVDLNRVAAEVLVDLEMRIQQSGAKVEIGTLPTLMADALQIRQLLQNLLANALKFHAPDTSPRVAVSSMRSPAGGWSIVVQDHGVGFDQVYVERIFRPFQRLHGRSEFEGSGMGLAICRKIVERHRGEISVRSRPGQGSVFTVTLPANPEEENDYATVEAAHHPDR